MPTRNNPFDEIERIIDRMSRQFEETARTWESDGPFGGWRSEFQAMPVDLVEDDEEFVVTVDLPGFDREEVTVEVTDQTLRIEAERDEETETGDERYLRHERSRASTRRSIRLPEPVETDGVSARMNNGVLTVTLPKLEGDEATTIDVE